MTNRLCARSSFLQLRIHPLIGRAQRNSYPSDGSTMSATSLQTTSAIRASLLALDRGVVWGRSKFEHVLAVLFKQSEVANASYSLAYAEMRLIMAKMLWNFDFELTDPEDDWMSRNRAYSVWYKGPLLIKLKQATTRS